MVLATLTAWESETYRKTSGSGQALGAIDRAKLNVNGSSLAAGHPFAATGGRIVARRQADRRKRRRACADLHLCRRQPGRHRHHRGVVLRPGIKVARSICRVGVWQLIGATPFVRFFSVQFTSPQKRPHLLPKSTRPNSLSAVACNGGPGPRHVKVGGVSKRSSVGSGCAVLESCSRHVYRGNRFASHTARRFQAAVAGLDAGNLTPTQSSEGARSAGSQGC